ncbi:acyl carrier protein [Umezawaea tangerina]|uniref:acyl carrier protein n=1 Tax=Umezawaea tangerina TaxID=84725 RepID=UPI000D04C38E|nr:acyl carrier protein [Umezawaea tangerina]
MTAAFRAGLDLPADADATALTFGGHPHWDSLGHMSLVTTIEEAFAVELSEDDVMAIDSYASAAAVLKAVVPVVP